jgi:hypothetical protein
MTVSRSARHIALAALAAATIFPVSCSRDVLVGENLAGLGGTPGASGNSADSGSCREAACQNHFYECGDCRDNDSDGLVDMEDPDCVGPCDDSEAKLSTNLPDRTGACTLDCYFDQDNGLGNDDCAWSHACDPLAIAPDFGPEGPDCGYDASTLVARRSGPPVGCISMLESQSVLCAEVCGPLTPNGCDCFGCCEIPGAPTPVWLGSVDSAGAPSCDFDHVGDPTRCRPCTQVAACLNPCDSCELCIGKRSLPPGCERGGCTTPVCPAGFPPCGTPCLPACRTGETCITGCCVQDPR